MIKTNKVKLEIHYDHIIRDYDLYKIQAKRSDDKEDEKCSEKKFRKTRSIVSSLSCAL